MTKGIFEIVNTYEIDLKGDRNPYSFNEYYRFNILISKKDGIIAWEPDNGDQHLNPQYDEDNQPIHAGKVSKQQIIKMLGQLLSFQAKKIFQLEYVATNYNLLVEKIKQDLQPYA